MKKLAFSLTLAASTLAYCGVSDFNSIIDENIKVQKELSKNLNKQMGTKDISKKEKPDFRAVGEEVVGRQGENYAVESRESKNTQRQGNLKGREFEKKNFKRLSQEFKDIK